MSVALAPEVVHVSPLGFGDDGLWGGGERYPAELALAMSHRVPTRLVTFGQRPRQFMRGALEVVVLRRRGRWRNAEINPLAFGLLAATRGARVIHTHHYRSVVTDLCLAIGPSRGQAVFCTDHGGGAPHVSERLRLDRRLAGMLAVSRAAVERFPSLAGKSSVILGGVDVERYAPGDAGRERAVLYVGRLLPHKGVDVLIDAVDPQMPLWIYGRPYDRAYMEILSAKARNKNVIFHHDASDDEVIAAYRRAAVTVLPSMQNPQYGSGGPFPELLGLVLLESMACGTPVIGSDVGGIPEVIADGEVGYVIAQGSKDELALRLSLLLSDAELWQRFSQQARRHVCAHLRWSDVAERCLGAYDAHRAAGMNS